MTDFHGPSLPDHIGQRTHGVPRVSVPVGARAWYLRMVAIISRLPATLGLGRDAWGQARERVAEGARPTSRGALLRLLLLLVVIVASLAPDPAASQVLRR